MKWIKPFIIGISGLFAVMLGISALMPSVVMTSKWVRVAGDTVRPNTEIRDLENWKSWNLLLSGATEVKVSPIRDTGASGSITWTDARGGSNSMRITAQSAAGIVTTMRLNNQRPFESGFSIEKRHADSTQIVWFIIEEMKWYPWEKFYGMMAADMKGPLMQKSLDQLKERMEE